MSFDKTIVVIIFVGFVLFGSLQTIPAFNIDEYVGVWYHIAVISNAVYNFGPLKCYTMNITKTGSYSFSSVYEYKLRGVYIDNHRLGRVSYNEIVESNTILRSGVSTSIVHSYNNGQDLILQPKYSSTAYRLISRSMDASPETIAAFKRIAEDAGVNIAWTENKLCVWS